ncbi:phosphate ABC transporter substrate-binding protein [Vibrio sp.]|uniref:Phosphate-binding protein n=1 Tax=Vibrio viridaestus TaxID=2487322 RepID=A0A3N9TLW8_9VIBR|nr:phosphate ABC transporter substrate-binding protein [Vibrio viridaestus]MDC0609755.1 phosphate ABC transporter substrate-binding protein [Vibrio sp.]RQW64625.1 phosphate ABC transporter substrate-binding protein [Vibrio viridaestus]
MIRAAISLLLGIQLFIGNTALAQEQITISGSTSVSRIMDIIAEEYNKSHPDVYVAVQGVGSTAGVTLLKKGVTDIAMSSRYLTEAELSSNLKVDLLAYDGLAVVVNMANPVTNLTRDQLYDVYQGKITNWKPLGGKDQKIAVVTREASSGTRFSFESLIGLTKVVNDRLVSDISPNNLVVNSNSMVKTLVNHNAQAIGFISTGSVDRSVKPVKFEGIEPTVENISNGKYQLSRPFLTLYYKDKISETEKKFIDFLLSDHIRELVQEYGYIPRINEE